MSSATCAIMMTPEFNNLSFFLAAENYWNVADEMLEWVDDDIVVDNAAAAIAAAAEIETRIDTCVFNYWSRVISELVNQFAPADDDKTKIDTCVFYNWSYVISELVDKFAL